MNRSALRDICGADESTYSDAVTYATLVVDGISAINHYALPTASGPMPPVLIDATSGKDDKTIVSKNSMTALQTHNEWAWASLSLAHEQLAATIAALHHHRRTTNTITPTDNKELLTRVAHHNDEAALWLARGYDPHHTDVAALRHKATAARDSITSIASSTTPTSTVSGSSNDNDERRCSAVTCNETATNACARCRLVSYCSKICQKAHWPAHKPSCIAPTTS
jgi:hypothetical protein